MSLHEQYSDIPRGQVIATYDTYIEAQRAVDFLADEQFAVENVSIVGSDLKMVEGDGSADEGRAAAAGAATAWFGLFWPYFASPRRTTRTGCSVVSTLIYGGVRAIFGFVSHALSGGKDLRRAARL
jgi:hypothetical protein